MSRKWRTRTNRSTSNVWARVEICRRRVPPYGFLRWIERRLSVTLASLIDELLRPEHPNAANENQFGCTKRTGTVEDARSAAIRALSAAISILIELPIEEPEDEEVLLRLLLRNHWHIPTPQQEHVAKRMARYEGVKAAQRLVAVRQSRCALRCGGLSWSPLSALPGPTAGSRWSCLIDRRAEITSSRARKAAA